MTSRWTRLWAAAGLLFVAAYILILALSGDNPQDSDSTHAIVSWYANSSNRARELVVFFVAAAGAFAFVWFVAYLRSLIRQADGDGGRASSVVLVSGSAFVALLSVMGAFFAGPAFVRIDAGHKFVLDPNTFRLVNGMGALAYMAAFIVLAPLCFTVGAFAWRTGLLPKWLAVGGFVAGIAALASPIWFPSFLVVLWILLLSGYLAFRPVGARVKPVAATAAV
jgi:hypothetical protein